MVLESARNVSKLIFSVYSRILSMLSTISSNKRRGVRLDIHDLRLNLRKIFWLDTISGNKINLAL